MKLSLWDAAENLAVLSRKVEEGEEIDDLLLREFGDTREALTASINRRKSFVDEIRSKILLAKKYRDNATKIIRQLEKMEERIKQLTIGVMQQHPGLPYKSSLGESLYLQNTKILEVSVPLATKSFRNILNPEDVQGLEPEYVQEIRFYKLDVDKLKADLKGGKHLSWAHLQTATHIRGL